MSFIFDNSEEIDEVRFRRPVRCRQPSPARDRGKKRRREWVSVGRAVEITALHHVYYCTAYREETVVTRIALCNVRSPTFNLDGVVNLSCLAKHEGADTQCHFIKLVPRHPLSNEKLYAGRWRKGSISNPINTSNVEVKTGKRSHPRDALGSRREDKSGAG